MVIACVIIVIIIINILGINLIVVSNLLFLFFLTLSHYHRSGNGVWQTLDIPQKSQFFPPREEGKTGIDLVVPRRAVDEAVQTLQLNTTPVWEEATTYPAGSWGSSLCVVFSCTIVCTASSTSLRGTTRSIININCRHIDNFYLSIKQNTVSPSRPF